MIIANLITLILCSMFLPLAVIEAEWLLVAILSASIIINSAVITNKLLKK